MSFEDAIGRARREQQLQIAEAARQLAKAVDEGFRHDEWVLRCQLFRQRTAGRLSAGPIAGFLRRAQTPQGRRHLTAKQEAWENTEQFSKRYGSARGHIGTDQGSGKPRYPYNPRVPHWHVEPREGKCIDIYEDRSWVIYDSWWVRGSGAHEFGTSGGGHYEYSVQLDSAGGGELSLPKDPMNSRGEDVFDVQALILSAFVLSSAQSDLATYLVEKGLA